MTEAAARPMEVELKYRMTDATAGERLLGAEELAGLTATGPSVTVVHDDRYVDTADHLLAAAGYAGRLRSGQDGTQITLKGLRRADPGDPIHQRAELEGPACDAAAVGAWPPSAARDALLEIVGDLPLADLVRIHQERRRRDYAADGVLVEVSVDDVEVLLGERVIERFAELEIELRQGDEAVLDRLAEQLSEVEELIPAETSKLERALEAVRREGESGDAGAAADPGPAAGPERAMESGPDGGAPLGVATGPVRPDGEVPADGVPGEVLEPDIPEPVAILPRPVPEAVTPVPRIVVGKTPGVEADDHLAEAGRKVLRFHLARMLAREPGARAGKEPEELHGMRVATRRQRAAWRVFGDAFDDDTRRRHTRRLRTVARSLGAVRDLDVLIEAGEAYAARRSAEEAAAFEPLLASWRVERAGARAILVRELDTGRFRRWLDAYIEFVNADGEGVRPVGPVEPHRVRDTMPSRIWSAYEQVRAYEAVMRWADVTTLHDLRIAAKWLRYTLEFVREALGRDTGPLIEKVVALQDHIGWLHDADVAAGLARAFLVEHAGDLTEAQSAAIGRYLVDRERELARLRRSVGPPWRAVSSAGFRRALGRVVAGL